MMPSLLHFLENNGTFASNNHTPLIAHTADDLLTTFTGLYGDRAGMPISNSYQAYNADGTTDPAGSFAYWTDPIFDTAKTPNPGHDTSPSMVYAASPPATTTPAPKPDTVTPAPWVPFTRAGCNVGEAGTVNQDLGANVGRAIQPTPATCDGATVSGDTVTPGRRVHLPEGLVRRAGRQPDRPAGHPEVEHHAVQPGE
jgi:hypothetical protein